MNYKEFTLIDLLFSTVWILIFTVIVVYIRQKNRNNPLYKHFIKAYVYKILMGFLFAFIYVYVYGGGDTLAYWQGGDVLNNLLLHSPEDYLSEMWNSYTDKTYVPSCYNRQTGFPPYWIYFEPNSWFISKISSFFSFFTFGSYLALNIIYSFISFIVSYRFYLFVNRITTIKSNLLLIAILFIPSVSFWCGGVSKDTVVYCLCLISIMSVWKLIYSKISLKTIIITLFSIYCLIQSRPFILIAILLPLIIILIFRLNRNSAFIIKIITRTLGITISFLIVGLFLRYSDMLGEFSTTNLIQTAETTYSDFQKNEIYSGKRYDLGIEDFSNNSLIKAIPSAVFTSIYRPFLWEAESVLMLLNGLESIFLIFMTIQLLRSTRNKKGKTIIQTDVSRDFIVFCLFFVIILGFFVGLTSGLFGVLSRLKAPILPFFMIFLFHRINRIDETETGFKEIQ